jgi:hypothetical protein
VALLQKIVVANPRPNTEAFLLEGTGGIAAKWGVAIRVLKSDGTPTENRFRYLCLATPDDACTTDYTARVCTQPVLYTFTMIISPPCSFSASLCQGKLSGCKSLGSSLKKVNSADATEYLRQKHNIQSGRSAILYENKQAYAQQVSEHNYMLALQP